MSHRPGRLTTLAAMIMLGLTLLRPAIAAACTSEWLDPVDGDWNDPARWSGGVPGSTDDACIGVDGTYTVTLHGSVSIGTLTIGAETGTVTLRIEGTSTAAAVLNTTWVYNNSGTVVLDSIDGVSAASLLVGAGGISNDGTLTVSAGSGGARTIETAGVLNQGTVQINADTLLGGEDGYHQNYGDVTVASGAKLTIDPRNNRFYQWEGTLDIDGAFELSTGYFGFFDDTVTGTPVLINSALAIASVAPITIEALGTTTFETTGLMAGQTLVVRDTPSDAAILQTAPETFVLYNYGNIVLETVNGPNPASLVVTGGGNLFNEGTVTINAGAGGSRALVLNGIFNEGTIAIGADTALGDDSTYVSNYGDILVDAGATLALVPSGSFNHWEGTLDLGGGIDFVDMYVSLTGGTVLGTPVLLNCQLNMGVSPLTVIARGTTTLATGVIEGQTLVVNDADGAATLQASEGASVLYNFGTLVLETVEGDNPITLIVPDGNLVNEGSLLINAGAGGARTLAINGLFNEGLVQIGADTLLGNEDVFVGNYGDILIDAEAVLTLNPVHSGYSQQAGTLDVGGGFVVSNGNVGFNMGTVIGVPVLTHSSLSMSIAPLTVVARGTTTLSSAVMPEQTLIVHDADGAGVLQGYEGTYSFYNLGTIVLESVEGANPVTFTLPDGNLVNEGSLLINAGAGGARTLAINGLFNEGLVQIGADTLLGTADVFVGNYGDILIDAEAVLTLNPVHSGYSQQAGTLDVGGGFFVSNGNVSFNMGTVIGVPVLTHSSLSMDIAPLTVVARGATTLSGGVDAEQTLIVHDADGAGSVQTYEGSFFFYNFGTIVLESVEGANPISLVGPTEGTMQNQGSLIVNAGTGGARNLAVSSFFNEGLIQIGTDTLVGTEHVFIGNYGDIAVAPEAILTLNPDGSSFIQQEGSLDVGGGFTAANGDVGFIGGTVTGTPVITHSSLSMGISPLTVVARGTTTLWNGVSEGQTLLVHDADGGATLDWSPGSSYTYNYGTIQLETVEGANPITFVGPEAVFNNIGTFTINAGTGGARTMSLTGMINDGTIAIGSDTLLGGDNAFIANTGHIDVAASASLTIDPRNNYFQQYEGGQLDVGGGFDLSSGYFAFSGGAITGTPVLTDSELHIESDNPCTVEARGATTFSGQIYENQTVRVHDFDGAGSLLYEYGDLNNGGMLILETVGGSNPITVSVPQGGLNNYNTLNINAGTGGPRTISAGLVNYGSLQVTSDSLTVNGQYSQTTAGSLDVQFSTAYAGSAAPVSVSDSATFEGSLNVTMLGVGCIADDFELISYASHSGAFAAINGLDLGDGRELIPTYRPLALTLDLIDPACPTPTPTETPTFTPSSTPTETYTHTPTDTPTSTRTFTPTHTPTETPTDTPTDTPTATPTETPTDTPTDTPTATPTDTPTSTPTHTPTYTFTPTFTWTPTHTPTRTFTSTPTRTPTATSTPTPVRHAMLFFSWEGIGKGITRAAHHYGVASEANTSFALPVAGRISQLSVNCSLGISVGTHTVTLRKNEADTALECVLSGGATSCTDSTNTVDFAAGDHLNLQIFNNASTQKPNCQALATLSASGGSGPYDSVITLHTDAESPADGVYCGMKIGSGSTATTCTSASADDVSIVMPRGGTLTALAAQLNNTIPTGKSETYTVRNLTTGSDAGLAVSIGAANDTGSATCSGSCSFSAGDRLAIRYNRVGTQTSRTRSFALTYVGAGSVLTSRRNHFGSGTFYGNDHLSVNDTVAGTAAVRMDRAAKLQRLYVHSTNAPTTAYTVTVCTGTTSPPSCTGTRPQCTVSTGTTTCSDTTNSLNVATGDYVEVRVTGQGNTNGTVGFSVEVADP